MSNMKVDQAAVILFNLRANAFARRVLPGG
jgi:hypothetical protein